MPSDTMTRHERLQLKYGENFPDLDRLDDLPSHERGLLWRHWLDSVIEQQSGSMGDKRLHWMRHRLMRWGHQWISTRDRRTWREVEAKGNRIRRTFNLLGPGLDFRIGLLEEQRPGWKHDPIPGMGVDGRETAEAQQAVVEWHFRTQRIWRLLRLAYTHAQTDGCCFLQVYVDKNAGPTISRTRRVLPGDAEYAGLEATGHATDEDGTIRLPLGPSSEVLDPGSEPSTFRGGLIRTRLLTANETYVDVEAQSVHGPNQPARWFISRRPRDLQAARTETGNLELEGEADASVIDPLNDSLEVAPRWTMGLPPYPRTRETSSNERVWDYTLYVAGDPDLGEDGLWVRVLGHHEMKRDKLPGGVIPVVRITDGSTDSEFYPRPVMSDWVSHQVTINALGSKILEYARMHSGSRLLALKDTLIEETYTAITGSVINYRGNKPEQMAPPRVSPDLWAMFTTEIERLEDKMGHNDLSRGKVSQVDSGFQDVSGRAVLGARELAERQFGPMIRAAADAMTDWAMLIVIYAQHLYKVPRLIPMVGRPDLAKRIDSETLTGEPNVFLDPETLMPLPRALRNQMLIDHLDRGLITEEEYRQRAPYAEVRSLTFGGTDHVNRAEWINTVLEERHEEFAEMDAEELYAPSTGLGIFWQDDPHVHMRHLLELALDERKPWSLRKLATDRWGIYAELARSKDHPIELEMGLATGQPVPRPPAPLEVLGVPNMVPQRQDPSRQLQVGRQRPGDVPGESAAPASSPAAELAATGPSSELER